MKPTRWVKKLLSLFVLIALLTQISACGYILHPSRNGQTGGRIDMKIAALDGIGLLFFLVPGLIAFAVDFSTGCIYLPDGEVSAIPGKGDIKVVQVNPDELNEKFINKIIIRETGLSAGFDLNRAEVYALKEIGDVQGRFAEIKNGYHIR